MGLVFNAEAFSRLRTSGRQLRLPKPDDHKFLGKRSDHPVIRLMQFATQMGLAELPARTVQMLRDHPYFRYVFYQVFRQSHPYKPADYYLQSSERRLVELLKDPGLLKDSDIVSGLGCYLNNFPCYLPGGIYRNRSWLEPEDRAKPGSICRAVDRAMKKLRITPQELKELRPKITDKMNDPDVYPRQLKFYQAALAVFDLLVNKYHYDPAVLWR